MKNVDLIKDMAATWNSHLILRESIETLKVQHLLKTGPTHPGSRSTDYIFEIGIYKMDGLDTPLVARREIFTENNFENFDKLAWKLLLDIGLQGINNAFTVISTEMYEPLKQD